MEFRRRLSEVFKAAVTQYAYDNCFMAFAHFTFSTLAKFSETLTFLTP